MSFEDKELQKYYLQIYKKLSKNEQNTIDLFTKNSYEVNQICLGNPLPKKTKLDEKELKTLIENFINLINSYYLYPKVLPEIIVYRSIHGIRIEKPNLKFEQFNNKNAKTINKQVVEWSNANSNKTKKYIESWYKSKKNSIIDVKNFSSTTLDPRWLFNFLIEGEINIIIQYHIKSGDPIMIYPSSHRKWKNEKEDIIPPHKLKIIDNKKMISKHDKKLFYYLIDVEIK
jgi:hypothetical protein